MTSSNQAASILVVEDDSALREALVDTLEMAKFSVHQAQSAEEALTLLGQYAGYSLIVSDVNMGRLSGHDLLRLVKQDYPHIPVVMDPVLTSGRGDELANEETIDAMRELLLSQVTILTPNSLEARHLAVQDTDQSESKLDLGLCAQRLLDMGCEYVLITGTHENTLHVTNTLYAADGIVRSDEWKRLENTYHGSGCTLASAIAASLANGLSMSESVVEAQDYTWHSLRAGFRPGMGQYIPNRFFWAKGEEESTSEGSVIEKHRN